MLTEITVFYETCEDLVELMKRKKDVKEALLIIFRETYEKYLKDDNVSDDVSFDEFLDDYGTNDIEVMIGFLEDYAKLKNIKPYIINVLYDDVSDFWTLIIYKVVPTEEKDLEDLKEAYENYVRTK
jgi:hypothetical protein